MRAQRRGLALARELAVDHPRDATARSARSKAIAPTQTESDQAAYGSRKAKVYGAALQLQAWDANAKLISGLICEISPPMSKEWRGRGEFGDASWLRQYLSQQYSENRTVHYDEARAKRKIEEASASLLTQRAMECHSCKIKSGEDLGSVV